MKKTIITLILGIITITFTYNSFAQKTAASEIEDGDTYRRNSQISSAIFTYNNAKRIAYENNDWASLMSLSNRYLLIKDQEWAATNAFSLAFRISYDMAIGDPQKTGIARNCRSGRNGLGWTIKFFNDTLRFMSVEDPATMNNLRFTAQQASNAINWLNTHHGNGCPETQAGAFIRTRKSIYAPNEKIIVDYSGMPGNQNDLVTIVNSNNKLVGYFYTRGKRKGAVSFNGMPAGTYEARIRFAAGNVEATQRFRVSNNSKTTPKTPTKSDNSDVKEISWRTIATFLRGRSGQFTFQCPANGTWQAIWGTDIYTDDSSICYSAVHAGIITKERGGTVVIELRAGKSSYRGSERNGVYSNDWKGYKGSFVFVR